MNNLNPTIAQALAPCAPPSPGAISASLYRWATPQPAAAPCGLRPTRDDLRGCYEHSYTTAGGLTLACYLDYDEAEPQTRDEPGCAERIELVYALVQGIDVSELLEELRDEIETKALAAMKAEAEDARCP